MSYRTLIALAVGLGAWLRLGQLGREGLWLDELFTARVVGRESWSAMIEDLARDVHPPGFFALLRLLAPVTDVDLRLPGAAAGLVTIVASAIAAARLGGRRAGVYAAAFVATTPALVLLDREARANGMVAATSVVLIAGVLGPLRPWWLLVLPTILLPNLHPFGLAAVGGIVLFVLVDPTPALSRPRALALGAVALVAVVPWMRTLQDQIASFVVSPWYTPPSSDSLGWVIGELLDNRPGLLFVVLAGVLLTLIRRREGPDEGRGVLLLVCLSIALVLAPQVISYLVAPLLRSRSAAPLLPALLLVSAVGLARAGRAGAALAFLLFAGQGIAAWRATRLEIRLEQWREAAGALVAGWREGDIVYASHTWLWRRYLPETIPLEDPASTTLDAAPGAWVLLGHEVEDPSHLAELTHEPSKAYAAFFGAALHKTGPLSRAIAFTVEPGALGLTDGPRIELWGASEASSRPLRAQGTCAIVVAAEEDAAGNEPARLRLRAFYGDATVLDEVRQVGEARSSEFGPVNARPDGTDLHLAIAFLNDAVVDGRDRNVHITDVRLSCR